MAKFEVNEFAPGEPVVGDRWSSIAEANLVIGQIYANRYTPNCWYVVRSLADGILPALAFLQLTFDPNANYYGVSYFTITEPIDRLWLQPLTEEKQTALRTIFDRAITERIAFHVAQAEFWRSVSL